MAGKLMDMVRYKLKLKHYSPKTIETYCTQDPRWRNFNDSKTKNNYMVEAEKTYYAPPWRVAVCPPSATLRNT